MGRLAFEAVPRALDANGDPINGAKLYVYQAGTTTPVDTYSDADHTAVQTKPVLSAADGFFPQSYLVDGLYKIVVKDASDVTIYEADNVVQATSPLHFNTVAEAEASNTGEAQYLRILDVLYVYDASGTDLVTADARTWSIVDEPTAESFGASTTGTAAANTTAFTALETAHPGAYIDLRGRTFAVSSIPTGANYYNGQFTVGSTTVSLRRNRLDNPFDGDQWVAFGDGTTHYWLFGMAYNADTGLLTMYVSPSWRHTQSYSAPLNVIFSDDKGQQFYGEKTIHQVDSWDIADAVARRGPDGRTAVVVTMRDSSNNYRNDVVYSDSNWETWTTNYSAIASPDGTHVYGEILDYPTSAGGADSGGYAVFGYEANDCHVITTTDNWATLSISEILVNQSCSEPSVVRVGTQDKWVMFARRNALSRTVTGITQANPGVVTTSTNHGYVTGDKVTFSSVAGMTEVNGNEYTVTVLSNTTFSIVDTSGFTAYSSGGTCVGGGNVRIATSTNLTTWSDPTDTNLQLENNPIYAKVRGGNVYVYLAIRDIDETLEDENEIVCIQDSISGVYDAADFTTTARRHVINGTERALGYFRSIDIGRDVLWAYTGGEYDVSTNDASCSFIVMGFTRRTPAVSLGQVRQLIHRPNFIRNPVFDLWSRGTSFSSFTTTTKTADGWTINPSGSTITATRVELTAEESRNLPFRGRYSLDISATADDYITMYQEYQGESELYRFADSNVTLQIWGLGDVPANFNAGLMFNYGSGGSSSETNTENIKFEEGSGQFWKATVTIPTPTIDGKTIGTDPYVRLSIAAAGNAAWDVQFLGIKGEFGNAAGIFPPVNAQEEIEKSRRYVQAIEKTSLKQFGVGHSPNSSTAHWTVITFPEMVAAPSVSYVSGSATDFQIYDGATSPVATAMAFSEIDTTSLSARATVSGFTANRPATLRAKAGATIKLLLDAE